MMRMGTGHTGRVMVGERERGDGVSRGEVVVKEKLWV